MPRFSANLSMLFTELPLMERFAAAARAGFSAVEIQFPYGHSPEALREALQVAGQRLVLHNIPPGDWAGGERGIACHPGREEEFRQGVERALEYCVHLDCPQLNCLAGIPPQDVEQGEAWAVFRSNLRHAADRLRAYGKRLLIEPLNTVDVPGFLLHRSSVALGLIAELQLDNLYLQYDVYHMQIMEGDLSRGLQRAGDRLGHVQIADVPGRHEPGTGEIRYAHVLQWLDHIGYRGYVGCEYVPSTCTEESFGWLHTAELGR